ncbi:MAG: hypothetical protein AAGA48_08640 [Myxococcota bacterium]
MVSFIAVAAVTAAAQDSIVIDYGPVIVEHRSDLASRPDTIVVRLTADQQVEASHIDPYTNFKFRVQWNPTTSTLDEECRTRNCPTMYVSVGSVTWVYEAEYETRTESEWKYVPVRRL